MNIHIARRPYFVEFLTTKTFQTNVNFIDLQFNSNDNNNMVWWYLV